MAGIFARPDILCAISVEFPAIVNIILLKSKRNKIFKVNIDLL